MLARHGKMTRGKLSATDMAKPILMASLNTVEWMLIRMLPRMSSSQNAMYPKKPTCRDKECGSVSQTEHDVRSKQSYREDTIDKPQIILPIKARTHRFLGEELPHIAWIFCT